jgi:hypothetical protein
MSGERQAALIVGMHRSGTSAVAGAVSLLGAALPSHMLPPAPDNPSGFWESTTIIATNDHILGAAGAKWHDCLGFDCDALDAQARANAETFIMLSVIAEFASGNLLLIKDPRICLLLDLWLGALRVMKVSTAVLLVLRHPSEVMASLAKRSGLPPALTTALWLRHMLAAEYASRGSPRQILPYDMVLRDWRTSFRRAGQAAAIAWPITFDTIATQMQELLKTELRHHYAHISARQSVGAPLGVWADEVHDALLALAGESADARELERLDRVRAAFFDWCRHTGRAWSAKLLADHAIRSQPSFAVPDAWEELASNLALTQPGRHIGDWVVGSPALNPA